MNQKRQRHSREQIINRLRDVDAMLTAGKIACEVPQTLEVSEATLNRRRSRCGGMKSEAAKRLKALEEENDRLKRIVADQALDISMLKEIAKENGRSLDRDARRCESFKSPAIGRASPIAGAEFVTDFRSIPVPESPCHGRR